VLFVCDGVGEGVPCALAPIANSSVAKASFILCECVCVCVCVCVHVCASPERKSNEK
jgi:hypothetical protein